MQQRVAALIVKKGKVLIARRSEGRTQAGLWEFPWGTCNQDEAPEACLERNLVDVMAGSAQAGSQEGRGFLSGYPPYGGQNDSANRLLTTRRPAGPVLNSHLLSMRGHQLAHHRS